MLDIKLTMGRTVESYFQLNAELPSLIADGKVVGHYPVIQNNLGVYRIVIHEKDMSSEWQHSSNPLEISFSEVKIPTGNKFKVETMLTSEDIDGKFYYSEIPADVLKEYKYIYMALKLEKASGEVLNSIGMDVPLKVEKAGYPFNGDPSISLSNLQVFASFLTAFVATGNAGDVLVKGATSEGTQAEQSVSWMPVKELVKRNIAYGGEVEITKPEGSSGYVVTAHTTEILREVIGESAITLTLSQDEIYKNFFFVVTKIPAEEAVEIWGQQVQAGQYLYGLESGWKFLGAINNGSIANAIPDANGTSRGLLSTELYNVISNYLIAKNKLDNYLRITNNGAEEIGNVYIDGETIKVLTNIIEKEGQDTVKEYKTLVSIDNFGDDLSGLVKMVSEDGVIGFRKATSGFEGDGEEGTDSDYVKPNEVEVYVDNRLAPISAEINNFYVNNDHNNIKPRLLCSPIFDSFVIGEGEIHSGKFYKINTSEAPVTVSLKDYSFEIADELEICRYGEGDLIIDVDGVTVHGADLTEAANIKIGSPYGCATIKCIDVNEFVIAGNIESVQGA